MNTNYSNRETFLRTASGSEKDALANFERLDDLTPTQIAERENDLRTGCAINARINDGYAGSSAAELEAEGNELIDQAIQWAAAVEAE